jgi:hypothetical protein
MNRQATGPTFDAAILPNQAIVQQANGPAALQIYFARSLFARQKAMP